MMTTRRCRSASSAAKQVGSLGHDLGLVEPGLRPEGAHDGDVEAPGAERRVGHVDDLVTCRVEPSHRRSHGHGLSRPDVAGDHAKGGLHDAEADAGDGFGMGVTHEEVLGRDALAEGGARRGRSALTQGAALIGPRSSSSPSNMASWEKSMLAVPACSS